MNGLDKLIGLVVLAVGSGRETAVNLKATFHGNYNQEDKKSLEIAKAEKQAGLGLLTGNYILYEQGKKELKKYT